MHENQAVEIWIAEQRLLKAPSSIEGTVKLVLGRQLRRGLSAGRGPPLVEEGEGTSAGVGGVRHLWGGCSLEWRYTGKGGSRRVSDSPHTCPGQPAAGAQRDPQSWVMVGL